MLAYPKKLLKNTCFAFMLMAFALSTQAQELVLEEVIVTANKRAENIQDVSVAITALSSEDIEQAGIIDITGLEAHVPGLRIGVSGGEVRPAMRGARTNEVGVAGTGIAEQVVGIFVDGIYMPTTTAGLGSYIDVERIEVLRGPQGTLYGRNTFAGTINVVTKMPDFEEAAGSAKIVLGDYGRTALELVYNLPINDDLAMRFVVATDEHDGLIKNHSIADDLRGKDQTYLRWVTSWLINDGLEATFRLDYFDKDASADAIWGYQQIGAYILEATSTGYEPVAQRRNGHIYQSPVPTALNQLNQAGITTGESRNDKGPYDVYRNAESFDRLESTSLTGIFNWGLELFDVKWTTNITEIEGEQFYDNDYSEGGYNQYGGFGRRDDQEVLSTEVQLTSNSEGPLAWVAGFYYSEFEANWAWLWRNGSAYVAAAAAVVDDPATPNIDETKAAVIEAAEVPPTAVVVPGWGNAGLSTPHKSETLAIYGQATYVLSEELRLVGGLRYNTDDKSFTPDGNLTTSWDDSNILWKAVVEFDLEPDTMVYGGISTGTRTGGRNDNRVVSRGAPATYDNEDVISYEAGYKTTLMEGVMTLNLVAFLNEYSDVKAQLFAIACTDSTDTRTVAQCASATPRATTTFEYYENGGDVSSFGIEADLQWLVNANLQLTGTFSYLDSEFDGGFKVGNAALRPLLGLGNLGGRQNVNATATEDNSFSFDGYTPALSPEYQIGVSAAYTIYLGDMILTPSATINFVDDYYAFDVNIPEVKVDAHNIINLRLSLEMMEGQLFFEAFMLNAGDEEVITRAVVHSQLQGAIPFNSIQVNYNNPTTWGLSAKYKW